MRKNSTRIHTSPILLLLLFICLIYSNSCKKPDVSPEPAPETLKEENNFFTLPANASIEIKTIAASIKKHDNKNHFLEDFIKRVGYPRWDKAKITVSNTASTKGRMGNGEEGEMVYVPFVKDSDNYVNSVLAVKIEPSDTIFRMVYANRYKLFGYDTTDQTKWNARNIFHLFTAFDNKVFGHTKFLIKDSSLFEPFKDSSKLVLTLMDGLTQNSSGRSATTSRIATDNIVICENYVACWSTASAPVARMSTIATQECYPVTICTSYNLGGGGTSVSATIGTGDGTGGGGSTAYYSNPCPFATSGYFY
jgi:hypothetical protein